MSSSSTLPAWFWWLLAAAVLAAAVGIPLLLGARRRRSWADQLSAASAEVAWFARVLVPQLQQQPTTGQLAGGWTVAASRVSATEDALTGLESTAPNESEAARALTLRDAVRSGRERVDAVVRSPEFSVAPGQLAAVAANLESAIHATQQDQPGTPT